jgi:hypothetical protein
MSRNAVVPSGKHVPLWDDHGRELAQEFQDYPYSGPLDAVSANAHEYGRPRLVERVAEALLTNEARPGEAHREFCSIPSLISYAPQMSTSCLSDSTRPHRGTVGPSSTKTT